MESEVSETPLIYSSTTIPSLPEKIETQKSASPSTSHKQLESGSSYFSTSSMRIGCSIIYPPDGEKTLQALPPLSLHKKMESEVLLEQPRFYSASSSLSLDPYTFDANFEDAQQYPYRRRFSYYSSYLDEGKPSMIGAGLYNLGNTCFLNSILQCFTHTVPLLDSLRSYNHYTPCIRATEGIFCVICTLRQHIVVALASSGSVISPYKFVDNLSNLSSSFRRFEQEDAHEFLQCLLDRLDSCCLDLKKQVSVFSFQEDSFVKKIFGGRLKSQLRCCNCGHCSDTFEPLIDLSLEIDNVETLPDALKSFTKVEKIEDLETKFTCEKCKQEVLLQKQFTLDKAPSVATFHLKRFKNDGHYVEKIDKHVEYPLKLDLQPYTNGSQNFDVTLKYELYAVVVHVGFTNSSGHYFCYIRSDSDTWHRMDDSKVVRVSERHVLSQEAYVLFYAREDTPWFSDFMGAGSRCMGQSSEITSPTSVLYNFNNFGTTPVEEKSKPTVNVDIERISSPTPRTRIFGYEVEVEVEVEVELKNDNEVEDAINKVCPKRKEAIRSTRSMSSSKATQFRASMTSPMNEKTSTSKKRKLGMSYDSSFESSIQGRGSTDKDSSPLRSLRRAVEF